MIRSDSISINFEIKIYLESCEELLPALSIYRWAKSQAGTVAGGDCPVIS